LQQNLKMSDDPDAAKKLTDVVRRLSEAREMASQKGAQDSRYRLMEAPAGEARKE
jgi:hypothetical protein